MINGAGEGWWGLAGLVVEVGVGVVPAVAEALEDTLQSHFREWSTFRAKMLDTQNVRYECLWACSSWPS